MKRKARIQAGIDDRLVAIYARKSRITNKGDSIGVQFKQSADYAVNQLSLPEDYEFIQYEDKGLSGYYSDRPDFQRLLRDVEMGKIKAVACYKLDRISRKTSDLMRLLEYFERHDVTLLVCSNNINTQISTSKIIIQVLAIIAEFERDILTERIQDNLMELAKDGRWLGGKTPTGFSSKRVTTGSGKNKSAISFLVPIEEEKEIVLEIYRTFWETRSLLQTANLISEKYETKHGAKFTTSTIRLILRNPIYCVADEYSYNYFLEHDGNLFGEAHEFDGKHGLSAYNKTDQMKVEDEDSTFFNPKFSQLLTKKPISEWIVSVGRHEGFISSRKWVETQNMLDEIAEKYNRPHRKTNALLSGLMYCPICGKRLRVLPESNRWTNGKPRFKYACPGVRAKECTFKGVEGVTLDEFVIHSLSSLQEEHSDYYRQLLENRVASMIRTDQGEKEYQETKKAIERLNADIAAQVRNLREADDALKRFIQDDIKVLTDDLAKREADLRRIENTQSENHYLIHELNSIKKRLLSFEEFAKDAQPETLFTLVHSIVDRIYITTDGSTQKCQVYIKGCATEDYSDILGAAEYIDGKFLLPVATYMPPMCDLDKYSIITLHQRKCISFTGRAGRLISTVNKKRITSSWEQRKLGELALFNPKDELPRTFEYVDLESVVGTEMLSHRTEVKSSAPSRAQRLAHTGDLFYQTVRPYQKNNYLFEKPDNNYVFSTGYAQMRPYVDGYFLLSLVQSERFVKVVLDNCTGTSYPAINANDLAEIEVAAPSDESEAQKIGTIFRCIDNLITLHQRKPFLMKWRNSDANRNQTNRLVL